jgi:hypothetical protein
MKRIYISCPLSIGDLATNIKRANDIGYEFAKRGYAPFMPQLSCYFEGDTNMCPSDCEKNLVGDWCYVKQGVRPQLSGRLAHHEWLAIDMAWIEASDVLIRITGDSHGADKEVLHAESHGIPVYYVSSVDDVQRVHEAIENDMNIDEAAEATK